MYIHHQIRLLDISYLITFSKPSSPLSLLFLISSTVGGIFSPTSYKYERDSGLIEDASVFGTPGVKEVLKGDRGEGTYSSISEPISESLSIALSSTLSDMLSDPKILPAEIGGLLVRNC